MIAALEGKLDGCLFSLFAIAIDWLSAEYIEKAIHFNIFPHHIANSCLSSDSFLWYNFQWRNVMEIMALHINGSYCCTLFSTAVI